MERTPRRSAGTRTTRSTIRVTICQQALTRGALPYATSSKCLNLDPRGSHDWPVNSWARMSRVLSSRNRLRVLMTDMWNTAFKVGGASYLVGINCGGYPATKTRD